VAAAAFSSQLALAQAPAARPAAAAPAAAGPAATPESRRAVRELLDAMDYPNVMRKMLEQMSRSMPQMMLEGVTAGINADKSLSEAKRKEALDKAANMLPQAIAATKELFADPTLVDDMLNEMVPLYAGHFTVAELHQMAVFYRTPVGRKMMAEMPRITGESMQIGQRVMMPRIDRMMKHFTAETGAGQPAASATRPLNSPNTTSAASATR
jgi:hypothetical protein